MGQVTHFYGVLGVGLILSVAGMPFWVAIARLLPAWLERSWSGQSDPLVCPVPMQEQASADEQGVAPAKVLAGAGLWLDLILCLGWCCACLASVYAWGLTVEAGAAMLLCGALLTLAHIDARTGLLPDMLTLPCLWLGMLFHMKGGWISLEASVTGAAVGYCLLWGIFRLLHCITGRQGMGYGDFKLVALLGAWLGVQSLPALILIASVTGAATGLGARLTGRLPPRTAIPFGPFLVLAGILLLFRDYAPLG